MIRARLTRLALDEQAVQPGDPPWLLTLADLVGLLLVFFVMLFAMSALDRRELERITGLALIGPRVEETRASASIELPAPIEEEGRDPDYLASVIRAKFETDPMLQNLVVSGQGESAAIFLSWDALSEADFDASGQSGGALIHALAGALRTLPNRMAIVSRAGGAGAAGDKDRWIGALRLGYRAARALEAAGVGGPIAAQAMIDGEGLESGLAIVVFGDGQADRVAGRP